MRDPRGPLDLPVELPKGIAIKPAEHRVTPSVTVEIPGRRMLVLAVEEALAVSRALYRTAEEARRQPAAESSAVG
jgi:hypothetical protein